MDSGDADAVAERVGRRIAELRRERGLTQEAFAAALDVTVQYVRRIELAKPNLTIASLVKIAGVLDCTVTTLFAKPRSMRVKAGRPRKVKRD